MNSLRSLLLALAVAPVLLSLSTTAHAWGAQGHRLVGRIADNGLDPAARAEVRRLLAAEPEPTLAAVAPWADQLRATDRDLGRRSAGWHYVNIGEDNCHYDAEKHCRDGNCVVEALKAQTAILADRSRSDADRAQALKFVVHLMGDIHQPMHAGYGHDKGGNDFQLQFGERGTNLHSLWDSGLLNTRALDDDGYVQVLNALPRPRVPAQLRIDRAAPQWAEASCRIAAEPGVYPASRKVGDDYTQRYRPVAETELRLAGERLARLLNQVLGER